EGLPMAVEVDIQAGRFDPAVESTIYFVTCEALTNAVKHARAHQATVSVRTSDQTVRVRVADDGVGGAQPGSGGLAGLIDRVRALGGELTVSSPPGAGTRIEANIPCE